VPIYNGITLQFSGPPQPGQIMPQVSPDVFAQSGPIIPIQIQIPLVLSQSYPKAGTLIPAPVQGFALIDTGASITSVHEAIFTQLGVKQNGVASVGTAGGPTRQFTYPGRITFTGANFPAFEHPRILGCNLTGQVFLQNPSSPIIALIGRDILKRFVFVYNGTAGSFSLSG